MPFCLQHADLSVCLKFMKRIKPRIYTYIDTHTHTHTHIWGFPGGSEGKVSDRNAGDLGSIPASGRSPGEGNGHPLQYSCLENAMSGGAW